MPFIYAYHDFDSKRATRSSTSMYFAKAEHVETLFECGGKVHTQAHHARVEYIWVSADSEEFKTACENSKVQDVGTPENNQLRMIATGLLAFFYPETKKRWSEMANFGYVRIIGDLLFSKLFHPDSSNEPSFTEKLIEDFECECCEETCTMPN